MPKVPAGRRRLSIAAVLLTGLLLGLVVVIQGRGVQRGAGLALPEPEVGVLQAPRSVPAFHVRQAVPPADAASATNISGRQAYDVVQQLFGLRSARSILVELSLYSDDVFGGTNGSNQRFQDVLAWVVTFHETDCPEAPAKPGESWPPAMIVIAVDALTGEYMNGHSVCGSVPVE
jgi:hypothetical protein